jgi:hypothetical protein
MKGIPVQGELFALFWERPDLERLHVNDVIRIDGRLGRVIRVNDCAAVVVMNRPVRQFATRFDKPVRFQPGPALFRISVHSEIEILNQRKPR